MTISGSWLVFFSSMAKANTCMSTSERKSTSPTVLHASLTLAKKVALGILTFNFLLSTAVLNRIQASEFGNSSSFTVGTEYCSSLTEKGSKPAINAQVSNMMIRFFNVRIFRLWKKEVSLSNDDKNRHQIEQKKTYTQTF